VPVTPPPRVRGGSSTPASASSTRTPTSGHLGQAILTGQDGVAWLVVDEPRYVVNRMGMRAQNVCATWEELADEIGLPPERLAATMAAYNEAAARGEDPAFGKAPEWVVPLDEPPFGAIDLRVDRILYAGFPLGGAVTDGTHGSCAKTGPRWRHSSPPAVRASLAPAGTARASRSARELLRRRAVAEMLAGDGAAT